MQATNWNQDWQFWQEKNAFALVWNVPENAEEVTLPHDAMLLEQPYAESHNAGSTGFRDGGNYVYRKELFASRADRAKTLTLKFEGIYMNAFVYVNEQLAAKQPFGYSGFYVELNDYLRYEAKNEIRVLVRNGAMSNSRWYSGGGIYRDVYLLEGAPLHIQPEGVRITTEQISAGTAAVRVETHLRQTGAESTQLTLVTELYDPAGQMVASDQSPVSIFAREERQFTQRIFVENAALWSAETPELYTCRSRLVHGEECLDELDSSFGIRTLHLDLHKGFCVNGEAVKLRGACIHHDSGVIGAATYEDAEMRRIYLLKDAGFNAVRISHHPAAPALLRACDKLGMYVMDETSDIWTRAKSDFDYGLFFTEWWAKDVEAMVRKDYNHPSVVLYSIGNEIPEIGTPHGAALGQEIVAKIRSLDVTRPTLAGINGVFASGDRMDEIVRDVVAELAAEGKIDGNVNDFMTLMADYMDEIVTHKAVSERLETALVATDIAGYNYMTGRYEQDLADYPNRFMVGSETYPPEIARNWGLISKHPRLIGDFTWTGWDYIGEAGVGTPAYSFGEGGFGAGFPTQLSYVGDIDICGVRRPASYYREIVFGLRQKPYLAVQKPAHYGEILLKTPWIISDTIASWTWRGFEGKPVIVEVYAGGTEVELFLNDESLGRKPSGPNADYRVLFDTVYQPGELRAVIYDGETTLGEEILLTAGKADRLEISEYWQGEELIYIALRLADELGRLVCDSDELVTVEVEGGELLGCGSGNPKPLEHYSSGTFKTWEGRGQVIVKKHPEQTALKVTARSASGLVAEHRADQ